MSGYSTENLALVSNLYYMEGLSQAEIAARLNISRVAVSRMLKRAREDGIVRISILETLPDFLAMSLQLEKAFDLRKAIITASCTTWRENREAIGKAGAQLLNDIIQAGSSLGIAWNDAVSSVLPFLSHRRAKPQQIHELSGFSVNGESSVLSAGVASEMLDAPIHTIPFPILAQSAEAKTILLRDLGVGRALEKASRVDIAVVGIGTVIEIENSFSGSRHERTEVTITGELSQGLHDDFGSARMVETQVVEAERPLKLFQSQGFEPGMVDEIKRSGAVGEILLRFFDNAGNHIPLSFSDRILSLDWSKIAQLPALCAIACGAESAQAILGALRSRVVTYLITDSATAQAVIDLM